MTLEALKAFGADTEMGLTRCVGNESLYFKLISMTLNDPKFEQLGEELKAGQYEDAFKTAHALKGVVGNLALTPVYDAVCEIVEPLRRKETDCPYDALYQTMMQGVSELRTLAQE